jgi:hypothetical protein
VPILPFLRLCPGTSYEELQSSRLPFQWKRGGFLALNPAKLGYTSNLGSGLSALWPRFSGNTRAGNLGCHRKMVNHDGFLLPLTRAFHPNSEGISILQYVSQGFKAQPYECILGVLRMNYYYWCGQCWVQNKVKNIRWGHLSKSLGTWRFWCKPCLNNIIRWFTKFKAKWPSPMAWAESQFKF